MSEVQKNSDTSHRLTRAYFQHHDTLFLSQSLLGKFFMTQIDGVITGGMITETEAYLGAIDKACHAYNYLKTERTNVMYLPGGVLYVYLCYGIHHLSNIVTHTLGEPHAILIRAIQPTDGIETILKRRGKKKLSKDLTIGPGKVSQALGITTALSGTSLDEEQIWIEDRGIMIDPTSIYTSPRIGIDYAEEFQDKPWRFFINIPS